jgi:hypothetical protein
MATNNRKPKKRAPAKSIEARENQLIAMANDLAEKQIAAGTATSQVITHYLKLGSVRAQLEAEQLRKQNELLEAKIEALKSAKRTEELIEEALAAMRSYTGKEETYDEDVY